METFAVSSRKLYKNYFKSMRKSNTKRLAVLFAALVLLEDIHANLIVNINENGDESAQQETAEKDAIETQADKDREKSRYLVIKRITGSLHIAIVKQ